MEKIKKYLSIEEIILAIVVLIPHIYASLASETSLLNWFYTDDAFYYFVTARNISEGMGSTFDGINPTNGFHPLWMLICIPVFSMARLDPILPLRMIILLQAGFSAGASILMYRMCKKHIPVEISLVIGLLWALAPAFHQLIAIGGVEAGLNAFSITLLWYSATAFLTKLEVSSSTWKQVLKVGVVASIAILSRLDNVFLAAIVGIWVLIKLWNKSRDFQNAVDAWKWRGRSALAYALPIVILFGSYVAWNVTSFGAMMPVSGRVKAWWGTLGERPYGAPPATMADFYQETFTSMDVDRSPWAVPYSQAQKIVESSNQFLGDLGLPTVVRTIWLVVGVLVVLLVGRRFTLDAILGLGLGPLAFACMAQIIYYKGTSHVAQRSWYWVSELFFTTLAVGVLLAIFYRLLRGAPKGDILSKMAAGALSLTIVVAHVRYITKLIPIQAAAEHTYLEQSAWLEANTEDGSTIAITNAGAFGYFVQNRTIVNMDGVINSMEYLKHLQFGTGAEHLASNGVNYVFGSPTFVEEKPPYRAMLEGKLEVQASFNEGESEIVLWRFIP